MARHLFQNYCIFDGSIFAKKLTQYFVSIKYRFFVATCIKTSTQFLTSKNIDSIFHTENIDLVFTAAKISIRYFYTETIDPIFHSSQNIEKNFYKQHE